MRPPFPGMDPWLEDPELWPNVHNSLIIALRDDLAPRVRSRYFVDVESRTTVLTGSDQDHLYRPDVQIHTVDIKPSRRERVLATVGRVQAEPLHVVVPMPDDEIEETFLVIKDLSGRRRVTTIEVLSPTNKKTKHAREEYLEKRRKLLRSGVNFVEIDLLRSGQPMPPQKDGFSTDYRILIFRPGQSREVHLYGFTYKMTIPQIPIPLLPEDPEPSVDLNGILHALYERACYDVRIDYRRSPRPRLRRADQAWATSIIAQVSDIPEGDATP